MSLTTSEIITLLRNEVNIRNDGLEDCLFMSMSDDDILLFIKLGASRACPDVDDLSDIPEDNIYAVVTLAKIELFTALATRRADKVDLGADNNNYIKLDQRFKHYMDIVKELRDEYQQYLDEEGGGTVSAYDVLLSNRHYTNRNYSLQKLPKVSLKIGTITNEDAEVSWKLSNSSHFGVYKLYISKTPIVDMFKDGAYYKDKLSGETDLVFSTYNIRDNSYRITGLESDTEYHVAVISVERNQLFGYSEKTFTTLSEFSE